MAEATYIERARTAVEKIQSGEVTRIYSHLYPDLDSLCSLYLLKTIRENLTFEFVSLPLYGVDSLPLDSIAVDIKGGAIDHHDIPGKHWSSCKIIYFILHNSDAEDVNQYNVLVDYCHRADGGGLKEGEKEQGSLIHTIYGLRDYLDARELYHVFEYLATASIKNTPVLYSLSDMTAAQLNVKYSNIIATENIEKPALIRRFVRFVEFGNPNRGESHLVAINRSNHNIIKLVFSYYKNVIAHVYKSPNGRAGIIFRKDSPVSFDMKGLREALVNAKGETDWYHHPNKNMLLCGSKKTAIESKLDPEDIVEVMYQYRI